MLPSSALLSDARQSLESVRRDVVTLERELGLRGGFTHRADAEAAAFEWNSICSATILEALGRVELEASSLCHKGTLYSTGCSGSETVGIAMKCLQAGFSRINIGVDMFALSGCVSA